MLARVVLIGRSELEPGGECFAQLRLELPALGLPGDRFIIRGASPIITIGGGTIVDAAPLKHRARDHARIVDQLQPLAAADDTERIALLVEMAGGKGLSHSELAARSGAADETISQAAQSLTLKTLPHLL